MYQIRRSSQASWARPSLRIPDVANRSQKRGDHADDLFNWMNSLDEGFAEYVLAERSDSKTFLAKSNTRQCNFLVWCFFDDQHPYFYKLMIVRFTNRLTTIFQKCIQSAIDAVVVPSQATQLILCDAYLFLSDTLNSLIRFNFHPLGDDSENLIMSEINKHKSGSFKYRMDGARSRLRPHNFGINEQLGMAFAQLKEVFSVIYEMTFGKVFRTIKNFLFRCLSSTKKESKNTTQDYSLSELREWDFRLAIHDFRYKVKDCFIKELNGTPKTVLLTLTFPIWFPWMLVKLMKPSRREKTDFSRQDKS